MDRLVGRPPPRQHRYSMDTDSTLTPAPLTPEPVAQKELEALHGEKLAPGVKVFSHGSKTWWKVDGEWYDLDDR